MRRLLPNYSLFSFFMIVLTFGLGVSQFAHAGRNPYNFSDAEWKSMQAQIENLSCGRDERQPCYKKTYEIAKNARLLPLYFIDPDWGFPPGDVNDLKESNMLHFIWNIQKKQCFYMETLYLNAHLISCCSNWDHGLETFTPDNPLNKYFSKSYSIIERNSKSLGSNGFLSFAELFYLDYTYARILGLFVKLHSISPTSKKPFNEVLDWSFTEEKSIDLIAKSIAFKVSKPDLFTAYALSPFFRHMTNVVNGTVEEKLAAKESLITEILLGFFMIHSGADILLLDDPGDLNDLIKLYDYSDVIQEMKDHKILHKVFDKFLIYLNENTYWSKEIKSILTQIKKDLDIEF